MCGELKELGVGFDDGWGVFTVWVIGGVCIRLGFGVFFYGFCDIPRCWCFDYLVTSMSLREMYDESLSRIIHDPLFAIEPAYTYFPHDICYKSRFTQVKHGIHKYLTL